jgi:hypothetical protein
MRANQKTCQNKRKRIVTYRKCDNCKLPNPELKEFFEVAGFEDGTRESHVIGRYCNKCWNQISMQLEEMFSN